MKSIARMALCASLPLAAGLFAAGAHADPFPSASTPAPGSSVHYKQVSFTVDPGGSSSNVTIPVEGQPVHMMVVTTTASFRAVSEATIARFNSPAQLMWLATDYNSNKGGTPKISAAFSSTPGTHIMYGDFDAQVDIVVANTKAIMIQNNVGASVARKVVITFMW